MAPLANTVVGAAMTLLSVNAASADFIFMTCGASSGSTYYMEGGLVTSAKAGWKNDGVDAKLQLLIKDDKSFDLISKGPPPNDFAYSEHGCQINRLSLSSDKDELVILAACPSQIETFFFKWDAADKTGELVRVDVAPSPLTKHGGALHAVCKIGEK
jgi:hypothetical protein